MTIARLIAARSGPVWKISADDTVADAIKYIDENKG